MQSSRVRVTGSSRCTSTRTTMLVRPRDSTCANSSTSWPWRIGTRNSSFSTAAVTTSGLPA